MSGHSKWHTIKHKKGALDAKRGKVFTKLIKEIAVAARTGGGDPDANARLRKAVSDAKGSNMPNDTIARAIRRGTGEEEGVNYEEIVYEGYGPGGVALLIEAMTDNRNRTGAEMRHVLSKHGGALRVRVAAPPVEGAANAELVRTLARAFGVAPRAVEIVSGLASKNKRVRVSAASPAQLLRLASEK